MLEVHAAVERSLDRDHVDIELVEIGQRRLVRLIAARDPLRGRAAPAGVAPHFAFFTQAANLPVEGLDPLLGPDRGFGIIDDLVDGRLLDLDDRRAGVGQRMILAVERNGHVHEQPEPVVVVPVGQHQGEDLRRDRADLDRPIGHRRDRLVGTIELEPRLPDRRLDRRGHAGLDHLPHQVAGPLVGHERGGRHLDARRADPRHALGHVADPASSGDVVVEPRIAVDHDVDPGAVLSGDVAGETVEMLLAVGALRKPVRERHPAQVLGVPTRPGQCPGRRRQQDLVPGGGEHRFQMRSFDCDEPTVRLRLAMMARSALCAESRGWEAPTA